MDYAFITAALQNRWNTWNIRGFMILGLCMQVLLTVFTPQRQRTSNRFVIFMVWSAYFLSDWAATFALGLISNAGCRNLENNEAQVPPDVLAFWAAFLLVHLGGPDNVTAFSMEDNALWMRHLVGLVAQISVFMYIFVKTLPNNRLLVPTILVFVTGVINYGERSRALYLASLENLKKTIKKDIGEEQSDHAHTQHTILKGLIVDIVPDLQECHKSRAVINSLWNSNTRIEEELNFLYELLYTKIKASNSTWGKIVRAIAYYSTLVGFILFCIGHKHQFHRGDLVITYALFAGVFILQVANTMTLMTSSFFEAIRGKDLPLLVLEQGIFPPLLLIGLLYITTFTQENSGYGSVVFGRHWSNKMAYFNILSHCFKQSTQKKGFIWNKLAGERHVSIDSLLWSTVYKDIEKMVCVPMDAARSRELYEARGDRALKQLGCDLLIPYIKDFQFEHTLLIWHIATEVCFNLRAGEHYVYNEDIEKKRELSKKLSDYMMYLLVRRPKLMSAVAGISHIRYGDTCVEVTRLGSEMLEATTMRGFCELILGGHANINEPEIKKNNHPFSVLKDSCELVKLLRRDNNNMWGVLYMVWVELLSYAAGHCRADSHARVLSEGGEFITVIWALMSFCGIGDHFPVDSPSRGLPDGNTSCSNSPAGADETNADRAGPHALRIRRREEDAEQVATDDDNNITEDPNYNSVRDRVFVECV